MTPVVIEVAINGATTRERNPHVPLSLEEIVAAVDACVAAGASVVHMHAGSPVVGGAQRHPPEPYVEAFRTCLARHPGLLMYPTLSGGGPGTAIAERYAHLEALRAAGLLRLAPIDPGTMNYGVRDAAGAPPAHDAVYVNTFGDVDGAFRHCRAHGLGWDHDIIWCMHSNERQIHKLSVKDGTLLEIVQLGANDPDPHGMCLSGGKLYYCDAGIAPTGKNNASPHAGWVCRIDIV